MTIDDFWRTLNTLISQLSADGREDAANLVSEAARANNGLTDGWSDLRDALRAAMRLGPFAPGQLSLLDNLYQFADQLVRRR